MKWIQFVAYSALGVPAALVNALLQAPPAVENLVRILSLMSVIGFCYGIAFHRILIKGRNRFGRWVVNGLIVLDFAAFVVLPMALGYLTNLMAMFPIAALLLAFFADNRRALSRGVILLLGGIVLAVGFQSVKGNYRQWFFGGEFRRFAFTARSVTPPGERACDSRRLWAGIPRAKNSLAIARHRIEQEYGHRFRQEFAGKESLVASALQQADNHEAIYVAWWLANRHGRFQGRTAESWLEQAKAADLPLAEILLKGGRLAGKIGEAVVDIGKVDGLWMSDAFHVEVLVGLLESGHVWANFDLANQLVKAWYGDRLEEGLWALRKEGSEEAKIALDSGNALLGLGLLYEDGRFVVPGRNASPSARFYALSLGHEPLAGRLLGQLLVKGWGVPRNSDMAEACFAVAANAGDEIAIQKIADIEASLPYFHDKRQWAASILRNAASKGSVAANKAIKNMTSRFEYGYYADVARNDAAAFRMFDPNFDRLRYPMVWVDRLIGVEMMARFANRINQLGNLAVAIREAPRRFSYLGMEVYQPLFTFFIPRVIWPDKPKEISGLLIGRQLGLSRPGDEAFAWSMPVFVEAWLAGGGYYYLFVVLLLAAGFLIILTLAFRNGETGVITVGVVGLVTMGQISASGLSATLGGAMQAVIFVFLFNWGMSILLAWYPGHSKLSQKLQP